MHGAHERALFSIKQSARCNLSTSVTDTLQSELRDAVKTYSFSIAFLFNAALITISSLPRDFPVWNEMKNRKTLVE